MFPLALTVNICTYVSATVFQCKILFYLVSRETLEIDSYYQSFGFKLVKTSLIVTIIVDKKKGK